MINLSMLADYDTAKQQHRLIRVLNILMSRVILALGRSGSIFNFDPITRSADAYNLICLIGAAYLGYSIRVWDGTAEMKMLKKYLDQTLKK